jgi:MFS family permease
MSRAILGAAAQRLASQMLSIAIVLLVLQKFRSPQLAGLSVFLLILPGLLLAPVAGALLDRYGRVRLMLIDYGVEATVLVIIAGLSLAGRLVPALLLPLIVISSLTSILTITGFRSLFPLLVPRSLWDRVNGLDSALYAITTIVGPPIAAGIVAFLGGEAALLAIAGTLGFAALIMIGLAEPRTEVAAGARLLRDSLAGVAYVVRNPTLRGLAISTSLLNLGVGGLVVSIPVLLLNHLHTGTVVVGQVFGIFGVAGLLSALAFGRAGSEGRERLFLVTGPLVTAASLVVLAFAGSVALVFVAASVAGLILGAGDVALFSLRQRRTDPAWFGRAFAVSMSLNYSGAPFGSALAGWLIAQSFTLPFLVGAALCVAAGVTALTLIPPADRRV